MNTAAPDPSAEQIAEQRAIDLVGDIALGIKAGAPRAQREHEYQKQEKKERKTPATPVGGFVVVPSHYAENIGYAAAMLESSQSVVDRHNAPALRSLLAIMTASPAAQPSAKDGVRVDDSIWPDDSPLTAEQCAAWLDAKYARHNEDEDRQSAEMIRKLSATTAAGLVDERKDSERYQFLRNPANTTIYVKDAANWNGRAHPGGYFRYDTPEQLDAAIDAQLEAAIGREVSGNG